jgi:hypothetical protein
MGKLGGDFMVARGQADGMPLGIVRTQADDHRRCNFTSSDES